MQMRFVPSIITALTALALTSCSTVTTEQYEATALTSYTWQVKTIQIQNSKFKIINPQRINPLGLKTRMLTFLIPPLINSWRKTVAPVQ
ncbi:Prokaryotic membrane lipoprotein lipid attachment site profile (plasmid) [Nostoc flagelliforme CCNUN1]|uniref:Prokaryotic membrane lipoprotein lipid attachment site profile n=1 Tax=Nostoc flagelliforme CCNUN1 TaxID=2038116 RepID=A0A2K8T975_9NOSO|nr:Prokaryotic membrane lipoprotein lipid attachment site profile [Nostoc flagelliforme CCNUN1]